MLLQLVTPLPITPPEQITGHNWSVQDLGGIYNSGIITNVNAWIPTGTNDLEFSFPNAGIWKVILECSQIILHVTVQIHTSKQL